MNRGISAALLVVGGILIVWGVNASDAFSSDVSRAFTGSPTDKAMWLLLGGAAAAVIGVFGLVRGSRGS